MEDFQVQQGAFVLDNKPRAAVRGPIALVQDGDIIEIDADKGLINLNVDKNELEKRIKNLKLRKTILVLGIMEIFPKRWLSKIWAVTHPEH